MLGGRRWASSSRAATRRSRGGPDANTTCQGWMLEFDGAHTARARASSASSRGTGLLGKNSRVEWRSLIVCSRSNMVAPPVKLLFRARCFRSQGAGALDFVRTRTALGGTLLEDAATPLSRL